jgi:phage shock protein B
VSVDALAVGLIFGFIPALLTVLTIGLVVARRSRSRQGRMQDDEEMRWMQQMNDGLIKLGERVEALETLLMERATAGEKFS